MLLTVRKCFIFICLTWQMNHPQDDTLYCILYSAVSHLVPLYWWTQVRSHLQHRGQGEAGGTHPDPFLAHSVSHTGTQNQRTPVQHRHTDKRPNQHSNVYTWSLLNNEEHTSSRPSAARSPPSSAPALCIGPAKMKWRSEHGFVSTRFKRVSLTLDVCTNRVNLAVYSSLKT